MPGPRKDKWVHGRSAHRQRSHDEAHAGAAESPLPPILKHDLVPQAEPDLIASQRDLDAHIHALRAAGSFAYDTEFIGERSYHPHLCVIQTATAQSVTIIDPLAPGLNLRGLWELIADDGVEKIVHAGEQDLEPVVRHIDRAPARVLDTQIVAAFVGCGFPTGQARLVRELLGADPGHGLTFSQWDHRPLSRVQTLYAANDVRYLPLLRHTLAEKARGAGNFEWALDECRGLCAPERYRNDAMRQAQRMRSVETLSPRELAVLIELLTWREKAAEIENLPPRTLVRDGILMDMSRNPVRNIAELDRVSGLPRPVESRWGQVLVDATRAGLDATLPDGNHAPFDRWSHRRKVNKLWDRAAARCAERGIDPAIATSKRELGQFIRAVAGGDRDREQAAGRLMRGWRRELLGELFTAPAERDRK